MDFGDDVPCRIGLLFEVRVGCAVWHDDPVRTAIGFGDVLVAYIGDAVFSNSKKHTNSILVPSSKCGLPDTYQVDHQCTEWLWTEIVLVPPVTSRRVTDLYGSPGWSSRSPRELTPGHVEGHGFEPLPFFGVLSFEPNRLQKAPGVFMCKTRRE